MPHTRGDVILGEGFDHHKGLRPWVVICQGDVDGRHVALGRHLGQALGGPARYMHHGLARTQVGDRHVFPSDTHAQSRAQGFGTCLFRGPALGIGASNVTTPLSLSLLDLGKDPVAKPISKPFERSLYSLDIAKVGSNAKDHVKLAFTRHIWRGGGPYCKDLETLTA